jgi:hypothetical protein
MNRIEVIMMRRLLVLLLLLAPSSANGQRIVKDAWYDLKYAGLDVVNVWTAPFHATDRDWATFAGVIGLAGVASIWDDDVDAWIVDRQSGTLGDWSEPFRDPPLVHMGSGHRMMKVLAVVWGSGVIIDSRTLRDAGMGCMASLQANAVLRRVLYKTVARTRPLVANGDQYEIRLPGKGWDYHAFPGGHGANAHACATYLSDRFDLGWFSVPLHAAAAGISIGRMVDRRHWLSDAIIGTAMGVSIGRAIAIRAEHRAEDGDKAATNGSEPPPLRIVPMDDGGVALLYSIRF